MSEALCPVKPEPAALLGFGAAQPFLRDPLGGFGRKMEVLAFWAVKKKVQNVCPGRDLVAPGPAGGGEGLNTPGMQVSGPVHS